MPLAAIVLNLICFPWETFGKLPQGIGWAFCAREDEKRASKASGWAEASKDYQVLYRAENRLALPGIVIGRGGEQKENEICSGEFN